FPLLAAVRRRREMTRERGVRTMPSSDRRPVRPARAPLVQRTAELTARLPRGSSCGGAQRSLL
ncbi:hypothetical protein AB4Z54_64565, partial [Streptomyces sp. MCAF7]